MPRPESSRTVGFQPSRSGYAELSTSHLMLLLQTGDPAALEQLVGRYWTHLVIYSSQLLGCIDDGKDVAQEVFVRAWEYRRRWKPGGSAERFLYRIARNLSLLHLRRREVRTRTEPELRRRSAAIPTPMDELLSQEVEEALERALERLPERRREAFLLVRVEGRSLGAVADRMGVSKRTVANHVYVATTDLEKALQPLIH